MEILNIVKFDHINDKLAILAKEYEKNINLNFQGNNFFVFPNDLYQSLVNEINIINQLLNENQYNSDIFFKKYDELSDKIYLFYSKIKESSYENDLFNQIKENMDEVINFFQKTDITINKIRKEDNSFSQNICEFEINKRNMEKSNYLYNSHSMNNNSSLDNNIGLNISKIEGNVDDDYFIEEKFNEFTICAEKLIENYKYKMYYANLLVKEEAYNTQEIKSLKENLPKNYKPFLLDYKIIIDELIIKQCQIPKEKLDFKYNFIIPNLNLEYEKGGEIFYPPYGWFGIGLNVNNLYPNKKNKNIKKAIAYYTFNNISSKKIRQELHEILIGKGLIINNDLQPKCRCNDKRNENKKVGVGIYLSPKINIIESNTSIIYFKHKAYKIALMVSILTDKIRQPDSNYWVLNPEDIEFNKIIFKEIYS